MTWTAEKLSKQVVGGEVYVYVRFTDSMTGEVLTPGAYRHTAPPAGWPDNLINARLDELNSLEAKAAAIALGLPAAPPAAKTPTQDELDRAAFLDLCSSYRLAQSELNAGVGKTTQADVDAAIVAIKSAYKDEYAPFIVGLF